MPDPIPANRSPTIRKNSYTTYADLTTSLMSRYLYHARTRAPPHARTSPDGVQTPNDNIRGKRPTRSVSCLFPVFRQARAQLFASPQHLYTLAKHSHNSDAQIRPIVTQLEFSVSLADLNWSPIVTRRHHSRIIQHSLGADVKGAPISAMTSSSSNFLILTKSAAPLLRRPGICAGEMI